MAAPSLYELEILEEFRLRIKDLDLDDHLNSTMQLIRWIRARENNLDQAEQMLRKHMKWREEVNFDQLELLHIPKQCEDLLPEAFLGFDNDNCPVILSQIGKWDVKRLLQEVGPETLLLSKYKVEKMVQESMKGKFNLEGVPVTQNSVIIDLEGLSIHQGTLPVLRVLSNVAQILEENFPESSKYMVVINAPWFFPMFYKCVKPFISEKTKSKTHIYGKTRKEWIEFLGSLFPFHMLPRKYGGLNDIEIP